MIQMTSILNNFLLGTASLTKLGRPKLGDFQYTLTGQQLKINTLNDKPHLKQEVYDWN